MKLAVFILLMALALKGNCQSDHKQLTIEAPVGYTVIRYDNIDPGSYGYSLSSWNDDGIVYSNGFSHKKTTYKCISVIPHFGFSLPFVNKDPWTIGFRFKLGIGALIKHSSDVDYSDTFQKEAAQQKRVSGCVTVVPNFYVRYNFEKNTKIPGNAIFYLGYRGVVTFERYGTPVIGFEYGINRLALGVSAHLTRINYYRKYSNGDREVAYGIYDVGSVYVKYSFPIN